VGKGEIYIGEDHVVIKLDDKTCGLGAEFNFKWADNSTETGNILEFMDLGEAAPDDRFNFRYVADADSYSKVIDDIENRNSRTKTGPLVFAIIGATVLVIAAAVVVVINNRKKAKG
ncbi:MAG: hypothetical protein J6X19_01775, partial [Clostridia bacterium]|nr:hypothetical protein [Clostridia bacterium]